MPITEQLQTAEQLQRAGLPHAAAVLIAEKIEAAAQTTHDTALDRLRTELRAVVSELRTEMAQLESRIASRFADLEKSIRTSQTVMLSAIAIAVAVVAGFGSAILTVLLKQ